MADARVEKLAQILVDHSAEINLDDLGVHSFFEAVGLAD